MVAKVRLSVKNLVSFVLRGGSIDSRFSGMDRALEGSRIHRKLQKQAPEGYNAEVSMRNVQLYNEVEYTVEGRADGVFIENDIVVIDEIKTTTVPTELITEDFNLAHWAQGQCYAYFYCTQQKIEKATVQLTYYQVDTEKIIRYKQEYTYAKLEEIYYNLLQGYEKWAIFTANWIKARNESITPLEFPFKSYRAGQRELAVGVYKTITQGERFFCQAATGIGKTISVIYPAIKAMGEGSAEKIFYLTAKTITRTAAQNAVQQLQENGLRAKSITITAKDKICFLDERKCNPEDCPYAKGYFDKVNDAVFGILQNTDSFDRQTIEAAARKYTLCPFELSLDLSLWCDVVICDYNYLFDPEAALQRFFVERTGDYVFLIDEAHNLPDRARDMYSATVSKKDLYAVKKLVEKKDTRLKRTLTEANNLFIQARKEMEEREVEYFTEEFPREKWLSVFRRVLSAFENYFENNKSEAQDRILDFYFSLRFFIKISEMYNSGYTTFYEKSRDDISVQLLCLDPSFFVNNALEKGIASILFSATLSPLKFYMETLGENEEAKKSSFASPFRQENLCLLVENTISTKYKDREETVERVAESILALAKAKEGNYIAYFPSYKYMNQVYEAFAELQSGLKTVCQQSGSSEEEREAFLELFDNEEENILAFCVMGGIFAEGIDLVGSKLQGCCIVGVGLPQINPRLEQMKEYYTEIGSNGYAYAYRYPGMNKVLQAAGRVIRTEEDKGIVLLIDSRFNSRAYKELFPIHWNHAENVHGAQEIDEKIKAFWHGVE